MTGQELILEHFEELFSEMESSLNGRAGNALHEFQKNAFSSLKQIRFPDRKHEDWKYTPVQKLLSPKYQLARSTIAPSLKNINGLDSIVIEVVNGVINAEKATSELKALGVHLHSASDAFASDDWKRTFADRLTGIKDDSNLTFDLLNFSFNTNGLFLDIPKGIKLSKPVEIRITHHDAELSFSHPLFFIRFGKESEATILERYEGTATQEGLINSMLLLHVGEGAHAHHIKWQNLPSNQNLVYKLLATQDRDSHFDTMAFDFGGQTVRNNVEVDMLNSNTYTSLQGGYHAKAKQSMDHQTRISHRIHHCESHEHYKGIVDDQASAAFNGKVFVHPDAQKTNAYQQNDTLVLSPFAVMNSKPQLEIYADDVKCSHGATIGQMDEKALFYLKSRGITKEGAAQMLKSAFLGVITDQVPNEAIRNFIMKEMGTGI